MLFVQAYLFFFLCAISGMAVAAPAPLPEPEVQLVAREMRGRGTVYQQLGAFGSCGKKHNDGDIIVALSNTFMQNRHNSPHCGRRIRATNTSNGKTIYATVADTCGGCGAHDVDFSVGAWNQLTNNAAWGVFPLAWDFA